LSGIDKAIYYQVIIGTGYRRGSIRFYTTPCNKNNEPANIFLEDK
jgi:hypothetical protein